MLPHASKFTWSEFEAESGVRDTPLLISARTQLLALSAMMLVQRRIKWDEGFEDAAWDDIDNAVGDAIYELSEDKMIDLTPIGAIVAFPSPNIPDKWLKCNGASYYKTDYPELWDALPDFRLVEVGTGLDMVYTPYLGDKFIWGAGIDSHIGDIGGEIDHTLTEAELPAHFHTIAHTHTVNTRDSQGNNTSFVSRSAGTGTNNTQATSASSAANSGSVGSGDAHNNMPPYLRAYWIIKALP